jgi:uncharacterized protein DUF3221
MLRWLALVALLAAACGPSGPPARTADITGLITKVTEVSGRLQLLVEEIPNDAAGSAKALVRTDGSTSWFTQIPGLAIEQGGLARAKVGARVSVWFDGPVATSYPVQGKAAVVLVSSAQ